MRFPAVALAGVWALASVVPVLAVGSAARHRTGPVTIRGTASSLTSHGFSLTSPSKGRIDVRTTADTETVEEGVPHPVLHSGDHVGVRGVLSGRSLAAIQVRIYPSVSKPKPYSVKGRVRAIHPSGIDIQVGGKTVSVVWTRETTVRVGSKAARVSDIRSGDRVQVHVVKSGSALAALHVHVYRTAPVLKHLKLHGTVVAVSQTTISLSSGGKRVAIALRPSTTVYSGHNRTTSRAIKTGVTATVYACCAGRPPVATSIHLSIPAAVTRTVLIKGSVISLSGGALTLRAGNKTTRVQLSPSTIVELGAGRARQSSIRSGDYVSVRGVSHGATLAATRIHIYPEYRSVTQVRGTIAAVSASGIVLRGTRHKSIRLSAGVSISLNRRKAHPGDLRPGDRVVVTVRLTAPGVTVVQSVAASRPPAPLVTIRGVIEKVSGATLTMRDTDGRIVVVAVPHGIVPAIGHKAAPAGAAFPGVKVTVRGQRAGKVLTARSVTLHLTIRDRSGRLATVSASALRLKASGGSTTIGITSLTVLRDGGHRLSPSALHTGTFVRIHLLEASPTLMHALSVDLLHPELDLSGSLTVVAPHPVLGASDGQTYVLHIGADAEIVSLYGRLALLRDELGPGQHVHLTGTARSDGAVAVSRISVRLPPVAVRGTLLALAGSVIEMNTQSGKETVRAPVESASQGTHTLPFNALVAGDDITIEGYRVATGRLVARKVTVHRKLIALSGRVDSLTTDGFVLSASDGQHHILLSAETVFTGGTASSFVHDQPVHVTGYLRGDGVVLATRVRVGKGSIHAAMSVTRLPAALRRSKSAFQVPA